MKSVVTESPLQHLLETVVSVRGDEASAANLAVLENSVRRDEMPPLHVHEEDEVFHVLEGSILVYAGEERVHLGSGQTFVARRGVPHTYRGGSDRSRVLTMTFTRSVQGYHDFLRAVARPVDSSGQPLADGGEVTALAAIAEASGIIVLGPPGMLPRAGENDAALSG